MAGQQKRLLSAPNSRLGKTDIVRLLDKDDAWVLLPSEAKQQLYSLLPAPAEGETPHDPNVHPFKTQYKVYIQNELRRWQNDLREGREVKKWRDEAMKAGHDRASGKYDEWKEVQRKMDWGLSTEPNENVPPKAESVNAEDSPENLVTDVTEISIPSTAGIEPMSIDDPTVQLHEHPLDNTAGTYAVQQADIVVLDGPEEVAKAGETKEAIRSQEFEVRLT